MDQFGHNINKLNQLLNKDTLLLVQPLPKNPTLLDRIRYSQQLDVVRYIHQVQETRIGS